MSLQEIQQSQLFRPDCSNWLGYKPCVEQRAQVLPNCDGCTAYMPADQTSELTNGPYHPDMLKDANSVGIIEMGGLGSILRTSAVSRAIHELNPDAEVVWYTHKRGAELLKYIPGVIPVDIETGDPKAAGVVEDLDVLINFEPNDQARDLCQRSSTVAAFALNMYGKFQPASPEAENFQRLQIDDLYRAANKDNMQQILLGSVGLNGSKPQYDLWLPGRNRANADAILAESYDGNVPEQLIGLNIGTSEKGKLKRWDADSFADLSLRLARRYSNVGIVLLSGPEDDEPRQKLLKALPQETSENIRVLRHDLEVGDFMAVVGRMDTVVTGDTFTMHAARAQEIPVIVLAGPMPTRELETIPSDSMIGPKLGCSPCYYRCGHAVVGKCMQLISVNEVERELTSFVGDGEDEGSTVHRTLVTA